MLENILYTVLNMSIIGAVTFTVIVLIRVAGKRWIHGNIALLLWAIVMFRLLVPVAISSQFSFTNFIDDRLMRSVEIYDENPVVEDDMNLVFMNSIQQVKSYKPVVYKNDSFEKNLRIVSVIWGSVAVTLIIIWSMIKIIINRKLCEMPCNDFNDVLQEAKGLLNYHGNVKCYYSLSIVSPVTIGVINSKIILPYSKFNINSGEVLNVKGQEIRYMLLHELAHIKRKDQLWKNIMVITAIVHWFNPVAWLVLNLLTNDIEFACDETVIKAISKEDKKEYAHVLLNNANSQQKFALGFSQSKVEKRLKNIIGYKKLPLIIVVLLLVGYLFVAMILLTNSKKSNLHSDEEVGVQNLVKEEQVWKSVVNRQYDNYDVALGQGIYFFEKDGLKYCAHMLYGSGVYVIRCTESVVKLDGNIIYADAVELLSEDSSNKRKEEQRVMQLEVHESYIMDGEYRYEEREVASAYEEYLRFTGRK